MSKDKQATVFALLFSDLMMGAMGVIIVLLVFLQVVSSRGMADSIAEAAVTLPPAIFEDGSRAISQFRLLVCGKDREALDLKSVAEMESYSATPSTNCVLKHYVFPESFKEIQIEAREEISNTIAIDYTLMVGGYFLSSGSAGKRVTGDRFGKGDVLLRIYVDQGMYAVE